MVVSNSGSWLSAISSCREYIAKEKEDPVMALSKLGLIWTILNFVARDFSSVCLLHNLLYNFYHVTVFEKPWIGVVGTTALEECDYG